MNHGSRLFSIPMILLLVFYCIAEATIAPLAIASILLTASPIATTSTVTIAIVSTAGTAITMAAVPVHYVLPLQVLYHLCERRKIKF